MDLGDNFFVLMINDEVGMPCKLQVDGTAGAPAEPMCKGAMLEKDSSWTACQWMEQPGATVDASRLSSESCEMLPLSRG